MRMYSPRKIGLRLKETIRLKKNPFCLVNIFPIKQIIGNKAYYIKLVESLPSLSILGPPYPSR